MELPGTIDVIQMASTAGRFLTGRLRIDHRVSKHAGETRRFIVPVIDLDVTVAQLLAGDTRPAIEPGGANGGAPPQIPEVAGAGEPPAPGGDPQPGVITEAQRRRLFAVAKRVGLTTDRVKAIVHEVTGQESTKAVTPLDYEAVVAAVEAAGAADAVAADAAWAATDDTPRYGNEPS